MKYLVVIVSTFLLFSCGSTNKNRLVEYNPKVKSQPLSNNGGKTEGMPSGPGCFAKALSKEGGVPEWHQVICEVDVTPQLFNKIQEELMICGYINEDQFIENAGFTKAMKSGLKQYQKDNNLPIGQLDFKTLEKLGIDY
jgi:hypothetical protein